MKSTVYLLVFLFITVPLTAQRLSTVLDSAASQAHESIFSFTDRNALSNNSYKNQAYLPDSIIRTALFGGAELVRFKKLFTHDFNGNERETIELRESYIYNVWDSLYKDTAIFNEFNVPTQIISYDYDENTQQWENKSKKDFLYDSSHNISDLIISNWNLSTQSWNVDRRIEYLYSNGNLDKKYTWVWDNDTQDWKYYFRQDYFYDNNNLKIYTINNSWAENTQEWTFYSRTEFFYNTIIDLYLIKYYQWDVGNQEWVFQYDIEFFYNSNAQVYKKISDGYPKHKNEYSYYSHGNLKQELISNWNYSTQSWDGWHDRYIWHYSLHEVADISDSENANFKVYPNPVENILQFQTEKDVKINQLNIYDIQGKNMRYKTQLENNRFDISNLQTGIYIYRIQSQTAVQTGKFVVKR